jgi:hypothetical protein
MVYRAEFIPLGGGVCGDESRAWDGPGCFLPDYE